MMPSQEVRPEHWAAVETAFTRTLQPEYPTATRTLMTETVPIDRPPTAKATVSRRRSAKPATVGASALALHLDCSRTYIGKLEAEGVIQRQDALDQSRGHLRYLRRERQQSPRSEADADHVKVKTEMLQLRLMEKQQGTGAAGRRRCLDRPARWHHADASIGMAARRSRDILVRRNIDAVVMQIRRDIAEACSKAADEANEPPLDERD